MLRAILDLRARPDFRCSGLWLGDWLGDTSRRHRGLFGLFISSLERGLLHLLLLLLLLRRERGRDRASPLVVQIGGILLVDSLLFFSRRVRPGDIEAAVLHEIEIDIAAARLAPSGEFRVASGELRGLGFLGGRLLRGVGAFLEIGRRARPPLRMRARRRQHEAAGDRGHQKGGCAWCDHGLFFLKCSRDMVSADCRHYWPACHPVTAHFLRAGCGLTAAL